MNRKPDEVLYKIIVKPLKGFDDNDVWTVDIIKPTFMAGDIDQSFYDTYEDAMTEANRFASTVGSILLTLKSDGTVLNKSYRYNYTPPQEEILTWITLDP